MKLSPHHKLYSALALLATGMVVLVTMNIVSTPDNDIPLPFGFGNSSDLAGSLTPIGNRNGITVSRVTFPQGTDSETLSMDTIYLVTIPDDQTITTMSLDDALAVGNVHSVNYFGYKYSSVTAATEKANTSSTLLTEQFPGQFFASAKARAEDPQHGNSLAAFEIANGITLSPTDTLSGGATLEKNSLYFIIVNESSPTTLTIRTTASSVCGDSAITGSETCDDGNTTNTDGCSATCTVESGYTCNGTRPSICSETATSLLVDIACKNISTRRFPSTDPQLPNKDFAAPVFIIKNNGTIPVNLPTDLRIEAYVDGTDGAFTGFDVSSDDIIGGSGFTNPGEEAQVSMERVSKFVLDPTETLAKDISCRAVLKTGFVDTNLSDNLFEKTVTFAPIPNDKAQLIISIDGPVTQQYSRGQHDAVLANISLDAGGSEDVSVEQLFIMVQGTTSDDKAFKVGRPTIPPSADEVNEAIENVHLRNMATGEVTPAVRLTGSIGSKPDASNGTTSTAYQIYRLDNFMIHGKQQYQFLANILDNSGLGSTAAPANGDRFKISICGQGTHVYNASNVLTPNTVGCSFGGFVSMTDTSYQMSIKSVATNEYVGNFHPAGTINGINHEILVPSVCGNGAVEVGETCDDGNTSNADGCSVTCAIESGYTCNTATPNVCTPISSTPFAITVLPLSANETVNPGGQNLTLLRFRATSGPDPVLLKTAIFDAGTQRDDILDTVSLWRDTDGDGTADTKVLDRSLNGPSTEILFSDIQAAQNRIIQTGQSAVFEIRGNLFGQITGVPLDIQLRWKTENPPFFLEAINMTSSQSLTGIKINGTCSLTCEMDITTIPSTLFHIVSGAGAQCGNGTKEGSETCDDGNTANGDGCSATCALESGYTCNTATPNVCTRNAACGNGTKEGSETCDDGNTANADGCSSVCARESEFRCTGEPSVCVSYLNYVLNLADTNHNGVVSETEALILTLDVADAPNQPFTTVSQFDIDTDGDVDNADVVAILGQLDILVP